MKAVDSHRDRLEPLFDVVPLSIVELIAQFVSKESSQIPTSIDQKLSVCHITFSVNRCKNAAAGSVPRRLYTSSSSSNFDSVSIAAYNHFSSPLTPICFSSTATSDGSTVGGSAEGGRTRWTRDQGDELTLVTAYRDVLRVVSAQEVSDYEDDLGPVIEEADDLSQPLGKAQTDGLPAYRGMEHDHQTGSHQRLQRGD